jgi:outer membrane protein, multidrug efflux system
MPPLEPRLMLAMTLLLATPALAASPIQPHLPSEEARFSTGTALDNSETDEWWRSFGDPALDALVVEALKNNSDIGSAQARMHQAKGAFVQGLSPLLPSASFDVGLSGSPSANAANQISPQMQKFFDDIGEAMEALAQFQPPSDDEPEEETEEDPDITWNGSALLNLGWNIDLGRSAMALRAARLDERAAEGDRDGVARVVVQQVVASWLDVRNARARVAVLQRQVDTNTNLLDLTRGRFEGGDARGLDVLQQQQQLAGTKALLPQAQQLLRLREIQLATLLGRNPSAPELPEGAGLPELPPAPGVGTPSDLMEHRPDVAAARTRWLASKARVGSTAASFAPTFQVGGNVGWGLRWFNEWDTWETYGISLGVSVPIFNGMQRHGALQQTLAGRSGAAHALTAAARTAVAEVESALARESTDLERLAALTDQVDASRVAYEESARQYAGGLVNYLTVLTSLASFQAAELNHLQAHRDLLGARADLHTALGSSWARRLQ